MAILVGDRVLETSTTTGQGTLTLAGAATGYQAFTNGVGVGNQTYYCIFDPTANTWEVGVGTLLTGTTLSRDTVYATSTAGSTTKINFAAGTKNVFCTAPATKYVDQSDVGTAPNQIPLNQMLGKLAFQDVAERNSASSLATSAGLTAVTAVTGSLTLATGGVTLANQTMASAFVWRIRAYGTYVAISSANTRQFTLRCYWGSTVLTATTTGNVLASTAQTTPWTVEFVITGSSATAVWVTGLLSSQVTSATIPLDNIATAASVTGLTTNSTLDFRVGQTGTATGDTINVHSVTMERIK